MYVYINSQPGLCTVGFYQPDGHFYSESDHDDKTSTDRDGGPVSAKDSAAARVHYLNGGNMWRQTGTHQSQ